MRTALYDGIDSIELIDQSEPDWMYTPLCENPGAVACGALADDAAPGASRVAAFLAGTHFASSAPDHSLIRSLEGALRSGSIRVTGRRPVTPQRLATYTQPVKPAKAQKAPARVASENPSHATPEEATGGEAECLKEASRQGAAFIA